MSTTEEATINADGTTAFATDGGDGGESSSPPPTTDSDSGMPPPTLDDNEPPIFEEEGHAPLEKGIDPAFYLLGTVFLIGLLYYLFIYRKRKAANDADDFFSDLDGEKFNLKLPSEVEEYDAVRAKCLQAGWQPRVTPDASNNGAGNNNNNLSRVMAQALMKRAIADIPMVQHIQKESTGMNKLYAQSMCSVKQWRAYQAAEALVSAEVDEVRQEADDIEPEWSNMIWRQAMQYQQMLKTKHDQEAKQAEAEARRRKEVEEQVRLAKEAQNADPNAQEKAAQKAAEELIKEEERAKGSKKAFQGGVKKGFLDNAGGGKKGKKK